MAWRAPPQARRNAPVLSGLAACLTVAAALAACGPSARDPVEPEAVASALARAAQTCAEVNEALVAPFGAIERVELNDDQQDDWVMNFEEIGCSPDAFCDPGGCERVVMLTDGDDVVLAWRGMALAHQIEDGPGGRRLVMQRRAPYCGDDAGPTCVDVYQARGRVLALERRIAADGRVLAP